MIVESLAPNQLIINLPTGRMFQSYSSHIVFIPNDGSKILLGRNWAYSVTTGKYRNKFLGENKAETQAKLESGEYLLDVNL